MKKFTKKLISFMLTIAMIFTTAVPAFASEVQLNENHFSLSTSNTGRLEVDFSTPMKSQSQSFEANMMGTPFSIKQYENNELIQLVEGSVSGDKLLVTNYNNGTVVSTEIIDVSQRVEVHSREENTGISYAAPSGSRIGYISYNPIFNQYTGTYDSQRISVYSKYNGTDNTSYTINGKTTDTLAIVAGLITSVLSVFVPVVGIGAKIATAIVSGLGGSIAGGAIGIAFSEDVSVKESFYTLTGYDYSTDRKTSGYDGSEKLVQTESSDYYNEWFYDGFTPRNWKDHVLAYWFWSDLFAEYHPGVESYS